MDFDFFYVFRTGTWFFNIALTAIAGGLAFYRGKMLLGAGFLFIFVLSAFSWMWSVFLYEWIVEFFELEMFSTLHKVYWGTAGVLELVGWAIVCAGVAGVGDTTK